MVFYTVFSYRENVCFIVMHESAGFPNNFQVNELKSLSFVIVTGGKKLYHGSLYFILFITEAEHLIFFYMISLI